MLVSKKYKKSVIAASLLVALCGCNDDDKKEPVEEIANQAPVVDAGDDITIDELTEVTLVSSVTDEDGDVVTYRWVQVAGATVELTGADTSTVSFTAPDVNPSETLTFELTVTDDDADTSADSVNVTVTHVNASPSVSVAAKVVEEKQAVNLTAVASDDGDVVSYSWQQTQGTEVTLVDADTATLSFDAPSVDQDETLTFSVSVTDDEGVTVSESVNVEVTQKQINLEIAGRVTDSPIVDATVTFFIGDEEVTSSADGQGDYVVSLSLDDDDGAQMISVVAQGKDDQSHARLMSILGTADALNQASNDNGLLTKDELFDVNVTNVTTANSALILRENLGEPVVDDEMLAALNLRVSQEEMFALATAIKVAIDKAPANSSLALPEGIEDTLALAQNTDVAAAYLEVVENTQEYEDAYQEIVADPDLIEVSSDSDPISFYVSDYHNPLITHPGSFVQMIDDNSARFTAFDTDVEATLTNDDGKLILRFNEGDYTVSSNTNIVLDGIQYYVPVEYIYHELQYRLLSDKEGILSLEFFSVYTTHYPNGELSDELHNNDPVKQITAISVDNVSEVALNNDSETILSLPVPGILFPSPDDAITAYNRGADIFSFSPQGSGETQLERAGFTWITQPSTVDDGVNELVITFDDGAELRYLQLTNSEGVTLYAVSGTSADGAVNSFKVDAGSEVDSNIKFDIANVPGVYTYAFDGETINEFWWELWPNGKAYSIETADDNGDGAISVDEMLVMYGEWKVTDNGGLSITRNRFEDYSWPGCFGSDAGCYLYNERHWNLFALEGNAYHVTNTHKFDFYTSSGSDGFDGVFDYLTFDNRRISKQIARPVPVPLPDNQYLPMSPPKAYLDLIDPRAFIGSELYGVAQNEVTEYDDVSFTIILNADGTYATASSIKGSAEGEYAVGADNSVLFDEGATGKPTSVETLLYRNDNFVVNLFNEAPAIVFFASSDADDYEALLRDKTSAASFDSIAGTPLALVDVQEDGTWGMAFVEFADGEVNIYTDSRFDEVDATYAFSKNDDGSIDLGGRLYLSLSEGGVHVFVTDEEDAEHNDYNFLFEDIEKAKGFVENINNTLNGEYHYSDYQ